jgi:hypothetical protein
LAVGGTTTEVARRFRLSAGRISQKGRQLWNDWAQFQGENTGNRVANEVAV